MAGPMKRIRTITRSIAYHHVIMFITTIATILMTMLLLGCTSNADSLLRVYLISMQASFEASSNETANYFSSVEIRAGYFGVCLQVDTSDWICDSDTSHLASSAAQLFPLKYQYVLDLVTGAGLYRTDVTFSGFIITANVLAFACICGLATFPGWHEEIDENGSEREVKPFPSRPITRLINIGFVVSSLLMFISTIWQQTAAVAATSAITWTSNGTLKSHTGVLAMVFAWLAASFLTVCAFGIRILTTSLEIVVRELEVVTDEDDYEDGDMYIVYNRSGR